MQKESYSNLSVLLKEIVLQDWGGLQMVLLGRYRVLDITA
jgi:hypothetical protein